MQRTIALVVNPMAGIGGPAGLKGSDGVLVQRDALARGARPRALERATAAIGVLGAFAPHAVVLTAAGAMGEDAVRAAGLTPRVVYSPPSVRTSGADTAEAVRAAVEGGADLVLFAGGDGTARDVCGALGNSPSRDTRATPEVAVLGIPAGVKMYSSCFAVSPSAAGALAAHWVDGGHVDVVEREVLDVDEEQLRRIRVEPRLFGTVRIPDEPGRTQARKAPSPHSEAYAVRSAALGVVSAMEPGVYYLLGPGSTVGSVAAELGVQNTPLGVDVVVDGRLVLADASEEQLLDLLAEKRARAVITVIGGQGFLLGRGNQQLSARVLGLLEDDPLIVVATEQKLVDLGGRPLIVDTGDPATDARLAGYVRVVTGAATVAIYPVSAPEDGADHHEGERP